MAKVSETLENPLCLGCSTLFNENDFYSLGKGEYSPYCKECCESMILNNQGELDIDKLNSLLKKCDKIFLYDLCLEAQELGEPYFYNYLDLLKKNKKNSKKYKDSDTPETHEDLKNDEELIEKWGITNKEDLELLEREYHEWVTSYEVDSKAMIDSVKQLCLVSLDIRKARSKGDVASLDKLLRIKSQILGDANLKPVQETGNAANEQVSIGMLIKKFEQEDPIPEDTTPDWIDEMKVWIVGQLARMEGLQSDVTDEYNKELSKYGIDVNKEIEEKSGVV